MEYLIDTHALIWARSNPEMLSQKVKDIFLEVENKLFLSVASIWEISIKSRSGKLKIKNDLKGYILKSVNELKLTPLPISLRHTLEEHALAEHHKDPFDRIMLAQARIEKLKIISCDTVFDKYEIERIW